MWVVVTYSSIETILFCWELPTEVLQLPGPSLWWSWSGRSNGYCLCCSGTEWSTRSKQKAREKIAAKTRGGGGWSRHLGNDKGMAQMAVLHMVWRSTSSGGLNPLVVDDFCPTWQNHVFAAEMQGQIPRLYLNVLGSSRAAPAVGDASITFTISDHRCISKFDTRKFDTGMFILTLVRCYFAKQSPVFCW